MNCPQCKKELPKDASVCPACGAEISRKPKSRMRKFIILGVVLAVVVAVAVFIISLDNPVDACMDAFINNRFDEASAIYTRDIEGSQRRINKLAPQVEERIDELVKSYREDEGKYQEVKDIFTGMMTFPAMEKEIQQGAYFVDSLHDSRRAYENAAELVEEGYYDLALAELDKVIPEDENYEQANKDREEYLTLKKTYETEVKSAQDKQTAILTACSVVSKEDVEEKELSVGCKNRDGERSITAITFAYTLMDENGTKLKFVDAAGPIYHSSCAVTIEPGKESGEKDILLPLSKDVTGIYPAKAAGCVETVTFDSETVWTNPYYKYWVKQVLTREEYKEYQESTGTAPSGAKAEPTPIPAS